MKIPSSNYSLDSFLEYLTENRDEILSEGEGRWLKVYLLYVSRDWQPLFSDYGLERMGAIWRFEIPNESRQEEPRTSVDYYAYEWREGLLLCFTGSRQEDYENTLKRFVKEKRGISEGWIPPVVFEKLRDFLLEQEGSNMYRFISRRSRFSEVEAGIGRPEYNRRLSYSGEDAAAVLKETQAMYGTLPVSMDFRMNGDKIQLNRNGLMVIRDVNADTSRLVRQLIEITGHELVTIRATSEKFQTSTHLIGEANHRIRVPILVAGKIIAPRAEFDIRKVRMLFGEASGPEIGRGEEDLDDFAFSFIDTYISEDALSFSATVVDDVKGTVFGLSANNGELVIVPKHRTTFESFVRFYENIVEDFDATASLATFSEPIVAR